MAVTWGLKCIKLGQFCARVQLTAPAALEIPSAASSVQSAPPPSFPNRTSDNRARYDPNDKRRLDFPPGSLPLTYGKVTGMAGHGPGDHL